MDTTTMKGTVQGYLDRAFDEMTDTNKRTPNAEHRTSNAEVIGA